jgi:hypothetical protein
MIIHQVTSRLANLLDIYEDKQRSLEESSAQSWRAIEDLKAMLTQKMKTTYSPCLTREGAGMVLSCDPPGYPRVLMADEKGSGFHASVAGVSDCFEHFLQDLNMKNALIESLCRNIIRLNDDLASVVADAQHDKASALASERDASRRKWEKNALEKVLRSKMPPQDFFRLMQQAYNEHNRLSSADLIGLDDEFDISKEFSLRRENDESPQENDFPSAVSWHDHDTEDDDFSADITQQQDKPVADGCDSDC